MKCLTFNIIYHPEAEKGEPQKASRGSKEQHEQKNLHFPAKQISTSRQKQTSSNAG